jgi:hypothetical protein
LTAYNVSSCAFAYSIFSREEFCPQTVWENMKIKERFTARK